MHSKQNQKFSCKRGVRRTFLRVLVLSLLTVWVADSAAFVEQAYGATVSQGTVKAKSAMVRSGASTTTAVNFCVKSGDTVAVLGEEKGKDGNTWYKIAVGNSTGFIRSDLLTKTDKKISVSDALVSSSQAVSTTQTNAEQNELGAATATEKTTALQAQAKETLTAPSSGTVGIIKGSSVRMRKSASTNSGIAKYLDIGAVVSILNEGRASDGQIWYQIRVGDETGFVRSDLVNKVASDNTSNVSLGLSDTKTTEAVTAGTSQTNAGNMATGTVKIVPGKGNIKGTSVRVRQSASLTGNIITTIDRPTQVSILGKTTDANRTWYNIKATVAGREIEGYVAGEYVTVTEEVKEVTEQAQPVAESNTADAFATTQNAQSEAAGDGQQTTQNTDTSSQDISTASIKGSGVRVREVPVTGNVVCQLSNGHPLLVLGNTTASDGYTWYQVGFSYQGGRKSGYVRQDLIVTNDSISVSAPIGNESFEASISALPESYKNSLRALHAAHPYWEFETVDTGLDWNEALTAESSVGKNLVSKNSIASWKSTAAQSYDWATNTWYTFDGGSWASASKELIAYYMDPRNFLTESGIYQFECLNYDETQQSENVSKMLAGTFMSGQFTDTDGNTLTYADAFSYIGKLTGVSPYLLAGRCIQEQGITGAGQSISGTVPGYEGYFNFFNIGAYAYSGRTAPINGLIYAMGADDEYLRPWNTRVRSIYGGAKYLADKYVSKGQNTLYFQKFNVVNSENTIYSHQYMSNIQAASSESARLQLAYINNEAKIKFRIPFYRNMPDSPCVKPTSDSNPNTYLSSLSVDGYELTPAFSGMTENYSLTVDPSTEAITINAASVGNSSAVAGPGTYPVNSGTNNFYVACKAQNGTVKIYTITVYK